MNLVSYPHPALVTKAEMVRPEEFQTKSLLHICNMMFSEMVLNNGIGLAANQIGILKRIIVMNIEGIFQNVMINPAIMSSSEEQSVLLEGCLSFKGLYLNVKRPNEVTVQFHDCGGNVHFENFTGLAAKCVQHEINHLDGINFIDKEEKIDG